MSVSFKTKANAGFLSAAVFLSVISSFAYRNTNRLIDNAGWVAHTHEVTETIEETLSEMKDLETGQRGFLLTGSDEYLDPYEQGVIAIDATLGRLQKLTADNEEQQRRIRLLKGLKDQKIDLIRQTIKLRQEKGLSSAIAVVLTHSGKKVMDRFRTTAAEMRAEEQRLLAMRNEKVAESTQLTMRVIMIGGILSLLVLFAATVIMNLAEHARSLAARKLEEQNRLREGLIALGEQLTGEQSVTDLAKNVIETIAGFVRAPLGAVYLADDTGSLKWTGGYGFQQADAATLEFKLGDGLIGQAAAQKRPISVDGAPNHYLKIRSSLGEGAPVSLLALPFLHEGKVKGAIELGAFSPFSSFDLEYLKAGLDRVAIAFNSAQVRAKIAVLLEETQAQAEELQTQQEELKSFNEELQNKTHELEAQQEELRQTNEELEEQRSILEEQTARLEETNREIQRARSEIEEKAAEVERASKYKSEFLANMSHELRTPLNSILLLSRSLSENTEGNLTPEQQEVCRTVHSSGVDLLSLINDILDLSKVEAGRLDINAAEVEVASLARAMENLFRAQMSEKGLSFKIEVAPECPKRLTTDRLRLEQILKNFLSNALKFTETGTVALTFERPKKESDLSVSGLPRDSALAISVTDTGIGIPKEKEAKIFEAFEQIESTASRRYNGAGLGLTIAKKLAGLLGGEIQVESAPAKGSRFTVFLPEALAPSPSNEVRRAGKQNTPESVPIAALESRATPRSGAHGIEDDRKQLTSPDQSILVIEDDPVFAKILYKYCRDRGFKCLLAGDGESGLLDAAELRPSAIILDLKLPGIGGMVVLGTLKSDPRTRHIPVHVMSIDEMASDVLKMGAIGFLRKPVTREGIESAIAKIDQRLSNKSRKVLIIEDGKVERESILRLVEGSDVRSVGVGSGREAIELLKSEAFDCMILDLKLSDMSGFDFLGRIEGDESISVPPTIVYTGRDLSKDEISRLNDFSQSIIIKGVRSEERLLDEVTLFLHRVESDLPKEKQQVLEKIRHREEIFEGKKLLVVDDDMRNVFALRSVFSKKGFDIVVAKTGKEAIEKLSAHPDMDAVLMDIMMPEMDGYEATKRIRSDQRFARLPIIALTAKAMASDREKCLAAGASDYLSKPIDMDHLLSLLRVWLTR